MISRKKTIKIITISIMIILNTFIMFSNIVTACDGSGCVGAHTNVSVNNSQTSDDGNGQTIGGHYLYTAIGYAYDCSIASAVCTPEYGIASTSFEINWDLYNSNNEIITNQLNFNQETIAGTAVGMKLYENRKISWWANGTESITLACKQKVEYDCSYTSCYSYEYKGQYYDNCVNVPRTCEKEVGITLGGSGWSAGCQAESDSLGKALAIKTIESTGKTYDIEISNPNDARCSNLEKYRSSMTTDEINSCNETIWAEIVPGETKVNESTRTVEKNYYYEKYGACINAHTAKATYVDKDTFYNYAKSILPANEYSKRLSKILYITKEEYEKAYASGKKICNNEDEYYVMNDNENEDTHHWHVFTPLNTKSTEGYTLKIVGVENLYNPKINGEMNLCTEMVKKYKNNYEYVSYIKPVTGNFTKNFTADLKKVENGCYISFDFELPTIQKFYGEEITEDSDILKGFNFYYRPIDIDNPFPNGINDDSYWKTWYDTEKKEPNLKESFKEVTYWTNNIDLNSIREYNEESSYLDWETMNIDGTSSFISTQGIINRSSTINKNSVYNLGCAPTNMCEYYIKDGKKVENPVYQPECKNAKIGVSCP